MDAITIENLWFSYDKKNKPVFADFNLTILKGTITALLGPNGAGKTTLLHLLLGLLIPDSGNIFFLNKPIDFYHRQHLRQMIGMVSQNEAITYDLSLMEYVLLGRAPHLSLFSRPRKEDTVLAEEVIYNTGLEHMKSRAVPSLSSGERQLAAIARALVQLPDILLCDEPTSHLDLSNSRKILKLMKKISKDEGRTIIFTTHDPNAAVAVADHVVLLNGKGLIADGDAETVFTADNLAAAYNEPVEIVQTEKGPVIMSL
jgi:iron complex transport system ATP-binding protein